MKRRYRYALLAIPVIAGFFAFAFLGNRCAASPKISDDQTNKEKVVMEIMLDILRSKHYNPADLDDNFSHKVFDTYIKRSDFNKKILLQSDIDELKTKYYNDIDDECKAGTFDFFNRSSDMFTQRIAQDKRFYSDILSKPFDFTVKESVELDPDKLSWSKDTVAMKEAWRVFMKYEVLTRYYDLKKQQEKTDSLKTKSDSDLEKMARLKVKKTEDDIFDRLAKTNRDDRMSAYLIVITNIFDPHSDFFAPRAKEDFDISITGQLEGIGATLQEKDGYINVTDIVAGSPCWKQGQLKAGDLILKVAQGDKDPVDIVGMRVDDAVKLIRGKKGTEVRLTVKKPDGSVIVIPIVRDVVVIEDSYAQSAIIDQQKKIGYIHLPSFYFPINQSGGHYCSEDVKNELIKLKNENVKGVILDLRDDGGGSLYEVIKMVGLFIPQGPVVQVKTRQQGVNVYDDDDKGTTVYDGPLIVLVNENSASASEILAAAIQDYKRGVIVGSSPTTFGKGTVQNFYKLDDYASSQQLQIASQGDNMKMNPNDKLGDVKVTIQKFYRINGGSTQLRGVTPDVQLPGVYDLLDDEGEKDLDYPMQWDQIPSAVYTVWKHDPDYAKVKSNSAARVAQDADFKLIADKAKFYKDQKDATLVSLLYTDYQAYKAQVDDENKKFKALDDPIKGMTPLMLDVDKKAMAGDTAKIARKNVMLDKLKKDPYVNEAANIMRDLK